MKFKQFDIKLNRKEFIIEKDGMRVLSKSLSGSSEDYYDFEDIGDKVTRERKRLLIPLFISILFFAYGTIMLIGIMNGGKYGDYVVEFYYTTGLIFFGVFYFFGKNHLYLSDKRNRIHIQFINNNPNKRKLESFLDELQKIKKNRLLEKYADFDEDKTLYEHRNQLLWLKENEYLTKDEYKEKLEEISENFKADSKNDNKEIGFKSNN